MSLDSLFLLWDYSCPCWNAVSMFISSPLQRQRTFLLFSVFWAGIFGVQSLPVLRFAFPLNIGNSFLPFPVPAEVRTWSRANGIRLVLGKWNEPIERRGSCFTAGCKFISMESYTSSWGLCIWLSHLMLCCRLWAQQRASLPSVGLWLWLCLMPPCFLITCIFLAQILRDAYSALALHVACCYPCCGIICLPGIKTFN